VLSALPLALVLHAWGWSPTFLSLAALSVVVFFVILLFARSHGSATSDLARPTWRASMHHLRDSLRRPGTQLGFWSHFVLGGSVTMFSLLWGFPFLSVGLGYGPTGAAALLTIMIVSAAVSGPLLGMLSARFPFRRSNIVLTLISVLGVLWAVLLGWPGTPPLWLVILVLVALAVCGPGSLIGFDFARMFNPMRSLGSASGVVNVGGFTSGFVLMLAVGLVLDAIDRSKGGTGIPSELYSFDAFRVALLSQYVVLGTGVGFMLHARRRTRRRLHEDEGIEVGPLWVSLMRALRRNSKP
jgi:sugar phosphate permease